MDFSSILSHPLKEEILAKLLGGTPPKDISNWLRLKYSGKDESHLKLSTKVLQEFAKSQYADYYKQFSEDLTATKNGESDKIDKKISASLLNNKTYQERLNELADTEINMKKMMLGTIMMIQDRSIQIFDKIQENPGSIGKAEYALIKWVEQLFTGLEKYDKIVNQSPDQIIQHNYTVQYVDQTNALIQEAIREVICEFDPDLANRFMDRLAEKLEAIRPIVEATPMSPNEKLTEAKLLNEHMSKEMER